MKKRLYLFNIFVLIFFKLNIVNGQFSLCNFTTPHPDVSARCQKQLETVCTNSTLFWLMFDASSKYPYTGLSYATNQDLGNFDECVSIQYEDINGRILGKYCPLTVIIVNILIPIRKIPKTLSVYELSKLEEHFAPRRIDNDISTDHLYSLLSVCLPDACQPQEIVDFFDLNTTGLVMLNEMQCATYESGSELDTKDVVVTIVLAIILSLIIVSTSYEIIVKKLGLKVKHEIFLAFSLIKNGKILFQIKKGTPEQIMCLNGLRTISMAWIISGHAHALLQYLPLTNTPQAHDFLHSWVGQIIRSAQIAVDTFFFISGLLWAYLYLKQYKRSNVGKQIMNFPLHYIHRYLRLTPALAMVYLFTISLIRRMGSGPLYLSTSQVDLCEKNWWKFFLYIQNFDSEMCILTTWYLSVDMQLFLLSPLVLIPIAYFVTKYLKKVLITLICLTVLSVAIPLAIRLSDPTLENDYETHSRFSDYLIGIITGIILRETKDKPFFFSRTTNVVIWILIFVANIGMNVWYYYVLENLDNVTYNLHFAFYKPVWTASLGWLVYSCQKGYGGIINWILSWNIFQIGSKLSYSMYLLHVIILMHWVGIQRNAITYTSYIEFYRFTSHFSMTVLISIIWVLAFEMPMLTIDKLIFNRGKREAPTKTKD